MNRQLYARQNHDFWIILTILILVAIGVIMVFSASYAVAYNKYGDVYYYLRSQLKFALIGFAAMVVTMFIDYRMYARLTLPALLISLLLLILVKVPGIGHEENGAMRWIVLGPVNFQPSEIAKISLILFFSYRLSKNKDKLGHFLQGLLPYIVITGLFAGLLVWEPHLSAAMIVIVVCSLMLLAAGAKIKHFVLISLPALASLGAVIAAVPYMRARILSFIDPFKDPAGDGYQVVQSLYAIGSGGFFGKGLGKSLQKFMYLPEPHNDFIFSIISEELGLLGAVAIIVLFAILVWRGLRAAMNAPDMFGRFAALGITCLIATQVIFNLAVVTSSMPPTGVSLPFLSAGGTSLVILMASSGILINISGFSPHKTGKSDFSSGKVFKTVVKGDQQR